MLCINMYLERDNEYRLWDVARTIFFNRYLVLYRTALSRTRSLWQLWYSDAFPPRVDKRVMAWGVTEQDTLTAHPSLLKQYTQNPHSRNNPVVFVFKASPQIAFLYLLYQDHFSLPLTLFTPAWNRFKKIFARCLNYISVSMKGKYRELQSQPD